MSVLGEERAVVVGAGSLGTVYGAALARAGLDVQLLAREEHARAIQARGAVTVDSFGEQLGGAAARRLAARADRAGRDRDPAHEDARHGDGARPPCRSCEDAVRIAASFQNGVAKDDELAAWSGPETVVGAVAMVGGTLADARPRAAHDERAVVPRRARRPSERAGRRGSPPCSRAGGLPVVVTDRIRSVEWSKLVHASPTTALPALTGLYLHEIFITPELARLYVDLVREGFAVAAAAGVELEDWASLFPVRTVATARARRGARGRPGPRAPARRGGDDARSPCRCCRASRSRRRLEVEAIQGYLCREGARLGVPTPVNRPLLSDPRRDGRHLRMTFAVRGSRALVPARRCSPTQAQSHADRPVPLVRARRARPHLRRDGGGSRRRRRRASPGSASGTATGSC